MTESYFEPPQPDRISFAPPEDALEGSDMDIAQRWVRRRQQDLAWREANGDMSEGELLAQPGMEKQYAEDAERLATGDQKLAATLAFRAVREVEDLLLGDRIVVAGQAHLWARRQQEISHIDTVLPPEQDQPQD